MDAKTLDIVFEEKWKSWLKANAGLRMDANLDMFKTDRRNFHLDRYKFASNHIKGGMVLDAACGLGYGTYVLREKSKADQLVGVDIDIKSVAYARQYYYDHKIFFFVGDVLNVFFPLENFQTIVSFETLEHVDDPDRLIGNYRNWLADDGVLILSVPNEWGKTRYHQTDYNKRMLLEQLDRGGFLDVTIHNQNSGDGGRLNRDQVRGITLTTDENEKTAECYIAVCRKILFKGESNGSGK